MLPMQRNVLLLLVFCCFLNFLPGQFLIEGYTQPGRSTAYARDIDGNVYVALAISGQTLGGVAYLHAYESTMAIGKFDSLGAFVHATVSGPATLGGNGISTMDMESSGGLVFGGDFSDSLDWGGQLHLAGMSNYGRQRTDFVGRVDAAGNLVWLHTFNPTAEESVAQVKALSNGNIAVVGYVDGPASFNGYNIPPTDSMEGYLMILDSSGLVQNFLLMDADRISNLVAVDEGANGDLYVSGIFEGNAATWQGTTLQGLGPTKTCSFFSRISVTGTVLWNRAFSAGQATDIRDICVDPFGNCYFAGAFVNGMTLDSIVFPFSLGSKLLAGKLDASGHALWMQASSPGATYLNPFRRVEYHPSGRLLFSGAAPILAGTFAGIAFDGTNNERGFATVLDTLGNGIWSVIPPFQLSGGFDGYWEDAEHVLLLSNYYSHTLPRTWDATTFPATNFHSGLCTATSDFAAWFRLCSECNWARGRYFADLDQDGLFGVNDTTVPYVLLEANNGMRTLTDVSGNFSFFLPQGSSTLQALSQNPNFQAQSATLTFPSTGTVDSTIRVRTVPVTTVPDVKLHLVAPATAPRYQSIQMAILYNNFGAATDDVTIYLDLDSLATSWWTWPNADTLIGNRLSWHQPDLDPFESGVIRVYVQMDPNITFGDTFRFQTHMVSNGGDPTPESMADSAVVVAQYDFHAPDKFVSPTESTPQALDAGEWITYQINFQNEGEGMVLDALVVDTLADCLDPTTFQFLGSNYAVIPQFEEENVLYFKMNRIAFGQIDPLNTTPFAFVKFRIKTKSGVPTGNFIVNKASIFLDQDFPQVTPDAILAIPQFVGTPSVISNAGIHVYPNPSNGLFTVSVDGSPISQVSVTDLAGRLVYLDSPRSNECGVDISQAPAGIYLLRVKKGKAEFWTKIVVR